jgi:hypothetical protein
MSSPVKLGNMAASIVEVRFGSSEVAVGSDHFPLALNRGYQAARWHQKKPGLKSSP